MRKKGKKTKKEKGSKSLLRTARREVTSRNDTSTRIKEGVHRGGSCQIATELKKEGTLAGFRTGVVKDIRRKRSEKSGLLVGASGAIAWSQKQKRQKRGVMTILFEGQKKWEGGRETA